jgi:hypothetical protein
MALRQQVVTGSRRLWRSPQVINCLSEILYKSR